jgi:hypothetical protein
MRKITSEEARAIKDRHSLALLRTPGIHGVGVQEDGAGNQTLVILADPKIAKSSLPADIEGLPVSLETSGPFEPLMPESSGRK